MNDECERPKPPPIGLMPLAMYNQQRVLDILAAMGRYVQAKKRIPDEWFDELRDRTGQT